MKEDLTAKQPALEQVTRDVALLLALEPPSPELMHLEEERKSVSDYYDRVWSMVDKLQRLLEKAMPQQMIGMGEWLARVNDWLRAQNPGMAIANGHDDSLGMLEDLRVSNFMYCKTASGLLPTHCCIWLVAYSLLHLACCLLIAASGLLLTHCCIWLVAYSLLHLACCLLIAASGLLPTHCCIWLVAYSLLHLACCLLIAASGLLPAHCCIWLVAYSLLHLACCLLIAASGLLPTHCCIWLVAYSLLLLACCLLIAASGCLSSRFD